jgi:ATP-dependent helicase HrpA
VEEKESVAVRALADESARAEAARRGLRRLLLLDVGLAQGRITTRWTGTQALTLAASPYPSTDALVRDVQLAAIESLLTGPATDVRTAEAYRTVRTAVRDRLEDTVFQVVTDLVAVLTAWRELDAEIRARSSLALLATAQDIRAQAARLVHDGFVSEVGVARLPHLARYLRAARHRLVKAADNPQRDADLAWQVADVEALYDQVVAKHPGAAGLTEIRWMLEELRVSLFAQQLGTPVPVSTTRIKKALAAY